MKKMVWPVFIGFIFLFVMLYLPIKIVAAVVLYFDDAWNAILWNALWGKNIPFAGFLLSILIFFAVGKIIETKSGAWFCATLVKHFPVLGAFITTIAPQARTLLEKTNGFIIAPFSSGDPPKSGLRFGRITAILSYNFGRSYFGIISYWGFPPPVQPLKEEALIHVMETGEENGKKIYSVIPNEIAIKIELTGGIAIPKDALIRVVEITFGEFIQSLGFGGNETAKV